MARLKLLALTAFAFLNPLAVAQGPAYTVPDGPRHFVVLVDSSFSMIADSQKPAPRGLKRASLAKAEAALTSLLYDSGKIIPAAIWYRKGRDLISVIDYGIDTKPRADLAYLRLKYAKLDEDYARALTLHNAHLARQDFQRLLRPPFHTQLNILAWALPMGIKAAAVAPTQDVQATYVILLNDAQMNDGSMVLENYTLSRHLPAEARDKLRRQEKLLAGTVRMTDDNGEPGEFYEKAFGEDRDQVVTTIFRATPKTSAARAKQFSSIRPLDGVSLGWTGNELQASFAAPSEIRGLHATLGVDAEDGAVKSDPFRLATHNGVVLSSGRLPPAATSANMTLSVEQKAQNPLLGVQTIDVNFSHAVVTPEGPAALATRARRWGVLFGALLLLLSAGCFTLYHRYLAKHFRLWLPDYGKPFNLAPMAQAVTSRFTTRVARANGEAAVYLELPHALIRKMFYPNAVLAWDPRLTLQHGKAEIHESKITELPRFVELVWDRRPPIGGEFEIYIERVTRSGRHERTQVNVRFFALPLPLRSPAQLP